MTRLLNGEYIQRGCASFDTPSFLVSNLNSKSHGRDRLAQDIGRD